MEGPCGPSFSPKWAQTSQVLRCPGTPDPDEPFPFPIFYREEPQAGRGRPADGTARAHSATLQGSHSVATAELLAPLQDTVRCILKRKPPGRSGQPWSSNREQRSGREAPEMAERLQKWQRLSYGGRVSTPSLALSVGPFNCRLNEPLYLGREQEKANPEVLNPSSLQPPLLSPTPSCFHRGPLVPLSFREFPTQESSNMQITYQ